MKSDGRIDSFTNFNTNKISYTCQFLHTVPHIAGYKLKGEVCLWSAVSSFHFSPCPLLLNLLTDNEGEVVRPLCYITWRRLLYGSTSSPRRKLPGPVQEPYSLLNQTRFHLPHSGKAWLGPRPHSQQSQVALTVEIYTSQWLVVL